MGFAQLPCSATRIRSKDDWEYIDLQLLRKQHGKRPLNIHIDIDTLQTVHIRDGEQIRSLVSWPVASDCFSQMDG